MDDETRSRYENKSKDLRAELKTWENEWADTHGGSKPGRRDIKNNPDIGTPLCLIVMDKVAAALNEY